MSHDSLINKKGDSNRRKTVYMYDVFKVEIRVMVHIIKTIFLLVPIMNTYLGNAHIGAPHLICLAAALGRIHLVHLRMTGKLRTTHP